MQSLKEEFLEILSNYQGILHKVNLIYFRNKTDAQLIIKRLAGTAGQIVIRIVVGQIQQAVYRLNTPTFGNDKPVNPCLL